MLYSTLCYFGFCLLAFWSYQGYTFLPKLTFVSDWRDWDSVGWPLFPRLSHDCQCTIKKLPSSLASDYLTTAGVLSKGDVRRSIKLANFRGNGLVAGENWLIKSLNHGT